MLTPCFYALNLPRTPMRIVLIGIGVNLALNFLNIDGVPLRPSRAWRWPPPASRWPTSPAERALSRQVDFGGLGEWAGFLGRVLLAAWLCGAAAWGVCALAQDLLHGFVLRMLGLLAAIAAAMVVYAGSAWLLRIAEIGEAVSLVQRRLGGGGRRPEPCAIRESGDPGFSASAVRRRRQRIVHERHERTRRVAPAEFRSCGFVLFVDRKAGSPLSRRSG